MANAPTKKITSPSSARRGIARWRWITVVVLWAAAITIWPIMAAIAYSLGRPTYTREGWVASGGATEGFLPFLMLTTVAAAATIGLLWFVPGLVKGKKPGLAISLLALWIIAMLAGALAAFLFCSYLGFIIAYGLLR